MSWTGSGIYQLPAATFPEVSGTLIDVNRYNPTQQDLQDGITACLAKNGENTPTSNLRMGSFKHTGAAAANSAGEYLTYQQSAGILGTGTILQGSATLGTVVGDTITVNAGTWTFPTAQTWTFAAGWSINGSPTVDNLTISDTINITDGDVSGVLNAPTAAAGTNTTQVATCAFVTATSFTTTLPGQTNNAGMFVTTDGTNASWAPAVPPFMMLSQGLI